MTLSPTEPEANMEPELLPCPFCGGQAFCESPSYGRGYWYVACDDCRAEGPPSKNGQDCGEAEAIAAWNRRTPLKEKNDAD